MTTKWMKSLHCKSKALDDVVHHRKIHLHSFANSSSCKNSVQSLRDIVEIGKPNSSHRPKTRHALLASPEPSIRVPSVSAESYFHSLTQLPPGHPSRNVVEIIFHSSWGKQKPFSGRVEIVFKIQNLTRTVTRFEEYREAVKSRASCSVVGDGGEDHGRSVADGNEVMRFFCLGGAYEAGGEGWSFHGGKGAVVCTFSGSGRAHESAGIGRGRRAMLVARVVAGRIWKQPDVDSLINWQAGYDSVSRENGELLVFDPRALLPCFLLIYKL